MRRFLAILLLALTLGVTQAQTMRGVGARPCADWTQARRGGGRDYEAEQWVLGYMSGLNVASGARQGSVFRVLDEKGAFAAIDSYCAGHPADMLWNAVKSAMTAAHGA